MKNEGLDSGTGCTVQKHDAVRLCDDRVCQYRVEESITGNQAQQPRENPHNADRNLRRTQQGDSLIGKCRAVSKVPKFEFAK